VQVTVGSSRRRRRKRKRKRRKKRRRRRRRRRKRRKRKHLDGLEARSVKLKMILQRTLLRYVMIRYTDLQIC
jgi:hypothetical protein